MTPSPSRSAHPPVVVDTSRSAFCRLRPLDVRAVRLEDTFWAPRRAINRAVTLPAQYELCETTGRLRNFRRAAGRAVGPFEGRFFNDSDVYKWLEAAAWTLATDADEALAAHVETVIALIAAAQDASGYLDTYFMFERAAARWSDLTVKHELYCAGHLLQAAIAHHRATGSDALLGVAARLADHIDAVFGPTRRRGACGHPEIEMALVELARETGEERYLALARFFVDERGQTPPVIGGEPYCQDHAPFRRQHEVVGHAVRALYLYGGATDIYAETGEQALWQTLGALWHDLQERKVYVTGGAGARHEGEAFGEAYELPNTRAYAETCAAIAHVMWAWRLLLVTGEARYAEAMETALYNGVLAGLSLDGATYFYVNPLADRGGHRRQQWFGTACCPPNIARLLASLPGYLAATSDEGVWLHLYSASTTTAPLPGGGEVTLTQRTAYPWDGQVTVEVALAVPALFSLFLRVPSWAGGATLEVNGAPVGGPVTPGRYAEVRRHWQDGDSVRLVLPLEARAISSHPHLQENLGRVALARGPLVYCLEGVDHPAVDVWDIVLPAAAPIVAVWEPALLGGVVVLRCAARVMDSAASTPLYSVDGTARRSRPVSLTAIPYYAWANRAAGPMAVWLPRHA